MKATLDWVEVVLGVLVVGATVLPAWRARTWWVRIWDFPRLQIGVLGALTWIALLSGPPALPAALDATLIVLLALAVVIQFLAVWRYSRLAPREVQRSTLNDPACRLSLTISNVLQSNRQAPRLLAEIRRADPDIVVCVETDNWWKRELDVLLETHPHTMQQPMANKYGMLLYSRLRLHEPRTEFLVQDDIPSFHCLLQLQGGQRVRLHCLHPRPPVLGEADSSLPREAELLIVARCVRDSQLPVVLCGDLNDVAWSRTTRQLQKVSGLLDPRKGRGMFGTFHASLPGLRVPLDHIFHSDGFRLVSLQRLRYVGSDHLPVHAVLSLEPAASGQQTAPEADREDLEQAKITVEEGLRENGR